MYNNFALYDVFVYMFSLLFVNQFDNLTKYLSYFVYLYGVLINWNINRIGGVMVSMFPSSV